MEVEAGVAAEAGAEGIWKVAVVSKGVAQEAFQEVG